MPRILIVFISLFFFVHSPAQELRCNVQVVSNKLPGTNRSVFQTLQQALYEFMNNTVWTNHAFTADEKIECTFMFQFDKYDNDVFKGTLQVQSSRPVYNSSYNTVMFNYIDNDLQFTYVENEPLEFSASTHISNLTSILAYYAYMVIGLDYDSFSNEGGSEFFTIAENIVTNAQNAPEKGWKSIENMDHKNRYWLVKDLLDNDYRKVRVFNYQYHRQGLDMMESIPVEGRSKIAESLKLLQDIYRQKPDPYMFLLQVVFDAKSDELVSLFGQSPVEEKNRVYKLLTEIDPANTSKYEKIKQDQ